SELRESGGEYRHGYRRQHSFGRRAQDSAVRAPAHFLIRLRPHFGGLQSFAAGKAIKGFGGHTCAGPAGRNILDSCHLIQQWTCRQKFNRQKRGSTPIRAISSNGTSIRKRDVP